MLTPHVLYWADAGCPPLPLHPAASPPDLATASRTWVVVGHPGPEWELGTWRWTTWGIPPPAPDAPILLPLPIPPSSPPNQTHNKWPFNGYSTTTRHCLEHSPWNSQTTTHLRICSLCPEPLSVFPKKMTGVNSMLL